MMPPNNVNVTIRYSKQSALLDVSVTPYRTPRMFAKAGDTVTWKCTGCRAQVDFNKNGTPFLAGTFPISPGGTTNSGPMTGNLVARKTFEYSVTLWPSSGGNSIVLDPEVDADPGGPPSGGKKKASKKSAKKK
jgi:hypothetical protein